MITIKKSIKIDDQLFKVRGEHPVMPENKKAREKYLKFIERQTEYQLMKNIFTRLYKDNVKTEIEYDIQNN